VKRLLKFGVWAGISVVLFILITNIWVVTSTRNLIFNLQEIPASEVALVLGTSRRTSEGIPNKFFVGRMKGAVDLYQSEKIKHLLLSGTRVPNYNEPNDMFKALGELGVPSKHISLDTAGFRTLDSVVRSKEVFGLNSITIVTQKFHCYRSLFIAKKYGIKAVAYSVDEGGSIGFNLAMREVLARSYAVIDLYIFQSKPRFLGEKIELDIK